VSGVPTQLLFGVVYIESSRYVPPNWMPVLEEQSFIYGNSKIKRKLVELNGNFIEFFFSEYLKYDFSQSYQTNCDLGSLSPDNGIPVEF
jgi:hypothetical protein